MTRAANKPADPMFRDAVTRTDEIAPGIFRFCTPVGSAVMPGGFEFSQFLILDDVPLLYQTGAPGNFPPLRLAIETVMPLTRLRYIAFSHQESDESGALNLFLDAAPRAEVLCTKLQRNVGIGDTAIRPPRLIKDGEVIALGSHEVVWIDTPHFPHGWEAGAMFERTTGTLFCGDIFTRAGVDHAPMSEGPEAARAMIEHAVDLAAKAGYIANPKGARVHLERLSALKPSVLAPMHGGGWKGDGSAVLLELADRLERL